MGLSRRLGVAPQELARVGLLDSPKLPDYEQLLTKAFKVGPSDPPAAQVLLAAAILSKAEQTAEGRLAAALALLARLVAKADPEMTLGPKGATLRADIMPNGWRYTITSWPRLRYAWREGLADLLYQPNDNPLQDEAIGALAYQDAELLEAEPQIPATIRVETVEKERPDEGIFQALDEITRMSPKEPEPVSVAIQEQWPTPTITFAVSALGLGIAVWGMYTASSEAADVREELGKRRKNRIKKKLTGKSSRA
jgi:hypothetical protein